MNKSKFVHFVKQCINMRFSCKCKIIKMLLFFKHDIPNIILMLISSVNIKLQIVYYENETVDVRIYNLFLDLDLLTFHLYGKQVSFYHKLVIYKK